MQLWPKCFLLLASMQNRMHDLDVAGYFVSYKPKIPRITIILEFYFVVTKTRNSNFEHQTLHSKYTIAICEEHEVKKFKNEVPGTFLWR